MKDVHTEHCCIVHGCKYDDDHCTVTRKAHPQSYPCEYCGDEGIDPTAATTETSIFSFKQGGYYATVPAEKMNQALMYIMGRLNNAEGKTCAICDLWMWDMSCFRYVSSVQGTDKIMVAQWKEVTKVEYDALKASLKGLE